MAQATSLRVEAARGDRPLDLLIERATLVNVFTREVYPADIGIAGGYIVHVGAPTWQGPEPLARLQAHGKFALPGFIDTHVHIESSMMSPAEFAAAVLPHGTTTVVIDPHEVANVAGLRGVRYMLRATADLPLRVALQVPSCVPAVPALETAGAEFGPQEIAEMLSWERVIGLAEVMDYVGVIGQGERMRHILDAALERGVVISGHCPGLSGRELAAYIVGGPDSDHEGLGYEELLGKLRLGMAVEARVSSFSESITMLGAIVRQLGFAPPNMVMCTDDIFPPDLARCGHMDHVVRRAIAAGFPPVDAVRTATLHGAQRHRLYDRGALAPGKLADILLVSDLSNPRADEVLVGGQLVARAGRMVVPLPQATDNLERENTVRLPRPPAAADLALRARPGRQRERVRVLSLVPGQPRGLETIELPVRDGVLDTSATPDVCLIAILERHGRTGGSSLALVKGTGLQRGAVASTVAHDSHNLLILGHTPGDMALAAAQIASWGGGLCCVEGGRVLAGVPLPIAGLMSPRPLHEIAPLVDALSQALQGLGMPGPNPLGTIFGLALPVIPRYGVTDRGLVDTATQAFIPLWADEE